MAILWPTFLYFRIHIIYIRFPYIKSVKNIIFENISLVSLWLLFVQIVPNLEMTHSVCVNPWTVIYFLASLLINGYSSLLADFSTTRADLHQHSVLNIAEIC